MSDKPKEPKAFTMEPFGPGTFRRRITDTESKLICRSHHLCKLIGLHSSDGRTKELATIIAEASDELNLRYNAETPQQADAWKKERAATLAKQAASDDAPPETLTGELAEQSPPKAEVPDDAA